MKAFDFVELCSGIGGFRLGLERIGWNCVWANDWNKYANKVYKKQFGSKELVEGDIREIQAETVPTHTLLTAGFPCQAFSFAGKRKGFEDTRGTLFYDIARVAEAKRPPLLLLENVKGLLSAQGGYCFWRILQTLDELGYLVEWQVLNSKHFGVPQNRERVFIIGHLRGEGTRQIFPIGETSELSERPSRSQSESRQTSSTLEASYGKAKSLSNMLQVGELWEGSQSRVYDPKGVSPTVHKSGGKTEPIIVANTVPSEHTAGRVVDPRGISPTFLAKHNKIQQIIVEHKKITERSGEYGSGFKEDEVFCLDSSAGRDQVLHIANAVDQDGYLRFGSRPRDENGKPQLLPIGYHRIRRLTPIECERLQGFPDGWTKGLSDTQRYKTLGNAVTVNVVEFLGKKLKECLVDN